MNSRDKILEAIRKGKPELQPLPAVIGFDSTYTNLAEQFSTVLQSIGGAIIPVSTLAEVEAYLKNQYDTSRPIISLVEGLSVGTVSAKLTDDPHQFENLHLAILKGQLGVAENGAIWVDEQNFPLRALPFIAHHLSVVLHENTLVGNMHEAYKKLPFQTGYGSFIAGPSKTADIEQSLVIGAHGPKSMLVFLIRK